MSSLAVVHDEVRRLRRRAWVVGALLPAAVALGALTTAATWLSGGAWLSLPRALPWLAWGVAIAAALALGRFLRTRLAERAAPSAVAEAIEQEQGLRRGTLVGLLEVEGTSVFADYATAQVTASLAAATARPAPRLRRRVQRALGLAVVAAVQVLLLASTSFARRPDGWQALMNPFDAWRGALVAPLRIADAPARAMRGAEIPLRIEAPGRRSVTLRWRSRGEGWREASLPVDSAGVASLTLPAAEADLTVLATDGRAGRDSIAISVVDRPFVGDITIVATYPSYLDRGDERLSADEPMRIPAGTRLAISGRASTGIAAAVLQSPEREHRLQADGTQFAGVLVPTARAVWNWGVVGAAQRIEDLPPALDIDVIPDVLPRVEILAPQGERLVTSTARVALELMAADDYGLRGVRMRVREVAEDGASAVITLSDAREALWSGVHTLDLASLGLEPGEAVEVTLMARDAAPGNRTSVSAPLILRVPTTNEARNAADDAAEAAVAAADAAARAQAELAERTANEARARGERGAETQRTDSRPGAPQEPQQPGQNRGATPNQSAPREQLGYEGAERAREIAQEQNALQEQVKQLEDAAQELEERLRQAGALDSSLQRQLQDAQRMLREAMTPEMQAAMQNLESSTQQLDGARTRQSLQELAQQQQRMREQLERSAEMLRRAALEGQMQTLADRGQDLANQQRARADSASATPPRREESEAMQQLAQDLAKSAEQLSQRLEQANARPGAEATAQAAQQAQRAADAMGRSPESPEAAQQAANEMQQAAESLAGARERQVSEWKAELTDALDRSVQEMMQLAREQDQLAQQARGENNAAQTRGQQSALQQGVQAAQERLSEEARKSALVSQRSQELMERARQRSAQAAREAAEGRQGQTEQAMRESADALRQAAAQLTRDRERAGNSQSATGVAEMLQQMQELARQQGGLNAQMQSILPGAQQQAGQQGNDPARAQQARELARSQREVARQLDEISDADPTGRAQELAREARALAAALDQGAVDPTTKARQEQLLRRMLDAGRSLEQDQREESQRREARAARTTDRVTPDGAATGAPSVRYRVPTWEELRGLSADDRRLVIEYFRRLNAEPRP